MIRYEAAVSKWFDDENDGSPYWSACYLRYEVLAEDPRVEIQIGIWGGSSRSIRYRRRM